MGVGEANDSLTPILKSQLTAKLTTKNKNTSDFGNCVE